jgi:hypothetical protein
MELLVPKEFQISKEEAEWLDFGNPITWRELLKADYYYHHKDSNYEGGLSFIDRLYNKIPSVRNNWGKPTTIKTMITNTGSFEEKQEKYLWVVRILLVNQADVDCYGI